MFLSSFIDVYRMRLLSGVFLRLGLLPSGFVVVVVPSVQSLVFSLVCSIIVFFQGSQFKWIDRPLLVFHGGFI